MTKGEKLLKNKFILFGVIPFIVIQIIALIIFLSTSSSNVDLTNDGISQNTKGTEVDSIFIVPSYDKEEQPSISEELENSFTESKKNNSSENQDINTKDLLGEEEIYVSSPVLIEDNYVQEEKNNTTASIIKSKSSLSSSKSTTKPNYTKNSNNKYQIPDPNNNNEIEKTTQEKKVEDFPPSNKRQRTNFTTSKNNTKNNTGQMVKAIIENSNNDIQNGSSVKIRLKEDLIIDENVIAKNTIITAIAKLTNERIELKISSIMLNKKPVKCNLTIYDLDGQEGVYVPGGLNQELAQESAGNVINQSSAQISIPLIGSISTNIANKKNNSKSIKIDDGHRIFIK